ncbi:hypothetical protein [Enterovibrio coralii]|nr:hypothetical protein [Enterovibrio coralii]
MKTTDSAMEYFLNKSTYWYSQSEMKQGVNTDMMDSEYIKHPINCETCNALTPHRLLAKEEEAKPEQDKPKTQLEMVFSHLLSFFTSDHSQPIQVWDDDEDDYQCEKCGTITRQ